MTGYLSQRERESRYADHACVSALLRPTAVGKRVVCGQCGWFEVTGQGIRAIPAPLPSEQSEGGA